MKSLRLRLLAVSAISILIALGMIWLTLDNLLPRFLTARYMAEMGSVIESLASTIEVGEDGKLALVNEPADPRFEMPVDGRYWQVSGPDGLLLRSRSLWDITLGDPPAGVTTASPGAKFTRVAGPDGTGLLAVARKLSLDTETGTVSFVVSAAFPEQEFRDAEAHFRTPVRSILLLTAAVLVGAALFQAAYGLRPLVALKDKVADIRTGRSSRLDIDNPSEVLPLAAELNLLLAEREHAIERARARASDLAHGLKTPLAVLLGFAEKLPPAERVIALQQIDLIRQRADRQLQSARLGVERMGEAPLAALLGKLMQVIGPIADKHGLSLSLDVDPELVVAVDPADLAEAVGNLLDNAVKWAATAVSVSARLDPDHVAILIEDDGPGIADKDRAAMLERGVHAGDPDGEGQGSGLGLAISADIAAAYGGRLALSRAPLGGLGATLFLPRRNLGRRNRSPA